MNMETCHNFAQQGGGMDSNANKIAEEAPSERTDIINNTTKASRSPTNYHKCECY